MPAFKTIYFPDYETKHGTHTGLSVAFSDEDGALHKAIKPLSSFTIRKAIGHDRYSDALAHAEQKGLSVSAYIRDRLAHRFASKVRNSGFGFDAAMQSTFRGGQGNPLHDWFPYLEGYSPEFVETIIRERMPSARHVFDPFCGSGTTVLTAAQMGIEGLYSEVNPACQFVISAKAAALESSEGERRELSGRLNDFADDLPRLVSATVVDDEMSRLFASAFGSRPFFDKSTFDAVLAVRAIIDVVRDKKPKVAQLVELAAIASLVPNSLLIRRGDLRFRKGSELQRFEPDFIGTVAERVRQIGSDLMDIPATSASVTCLGSDIRNVRCDTSLRFDAIITSPPYLNGTNYFRNTKIELWFLRELMSKHGLRTYRDAAITAGINDVTSAKASLSKASKLARLNDVVSQLSKNAYDQRIPMMVASYFAEMTEALKKLKEFSHQGTTVAIDLGDSCYGDVWVPTDLIIREIMMELGFCFQEEVILRERISRSGKPLRQTLQIFGVWKP